MRNLKVEKITRLNHFTLLILGIDEFTRIITSKIIYLILNMLMEMNYYIKRIVS